MKPSFSSSVSKRQTFSVQELCLTAVLIALVFLATFVPRIPIPLGYAHLGDAVIFLMALLVPRRDALTAACLGSALSDVIGGFLIWAVPTLIIKFVMADIVWRIADSQKNNRMRIVVALILSSIWMIAAYALFGAVLYDSMAAGLASAPGLLMEGAVNTMVAFALLPALKRITFLQR